MQPERTRQFFHLFMGSQNRIYAYILTFIPNGADADDIMQETASVLWEKFETFTPGTDFALWGAKIAYYKILDYRKRAGGRRVVFSEDLMRLLADQAETVIEQVDPRLDVLKTCLGRLNQQDRCLVRLHYEQGLTVKGIAEQSQRSVQGLYKVMVRIHDQLRRCVKFHLAAGGVLE